MQKKPFINYEDLKKIAEKYPTPFYLYDQKGIRQNVENLCKAFSWNKGFKAVSYTHLTLPTTPYV